MRVALLALSVRGAMGQYLDALVPPLAEKAEVHLFIPEHYSGQAGSAVIHRFKTGQNRQQALVRLTDPYSAWVLWNRIRSVKPSVLHLFNGEGYPWAIALARWSSRYGIPLLVTLHDPVPHPGNLWELLNAQLRRYVIRYANSVHIHSSVFQRVAEGLGARNLTVIPHGDISPRFLQHRRDGVGRERVVLFFGRIEPYKGLDVLVEAAFKLKGKLRFVIAGPGHIPGELLDVIRSNPEIFTLHNRFIPDEEVALLFQQASILALPYKQVTQSSLPLLAASFGVPVVASALGGFLEDVPRVNGVLVPPLDPQALARGIEEAQTKTTRLPIDLGFNVLSKRFMEWYKCHGIA